MVLAMVLVLVVTIISSVVLSAAFTAKTDIEYNRASQQAYLTVSDAARYFSNQINLFTVTDKWDKYYVGDVGYPGEPIDPEYSGGSVFEPLMTSIVEKYKDNKQTFSASFILRPDASGSGLDSSIIEDFEERSGDIRVTVNSDSKCDIISTFELLGENRTVKYRMTVFSECNTSETCNKTNAPDPNDPNTLRVWEHHTKVWSWAEGVVERGFGTSQND